MRRDEKPFENRKLHRQKKTKQACATEDQRRQSDLTGRTDDEFRPRDTPELFPIPTFDALSLIDHAMCPSDDLLQFADNFVIGKPQAGISQIGKCLTIEQAPLLEIVQRDSS